jgi:hypothetical protein
VPQPHLYHQKLLRIDHELTPVGFIALFGPPSPHWGRHAIRSVVDFKEVLSDTEADLAPLQPFFLACSTNPLPAIEADTMVIRASSAFVPFIPLQTYQDAFCAGYVSKIGETSRPMAKQRFALVRRLFFR